jgi:glycosyltransferase involved in cell wall biosynthesis
MSKNLVSVIIPNYNHANYLTERIESVLNQTYQDFELIILDDCSPDNGASKDIIEQYRSNPHVSHIIYNDTNSGSTFKQWHKGLEVARGELVWIAESDDSCAPELLETLVRGYMEHNAVLAFCRSEKYDSKGNMEHYLHQANLKQDIAMYGRDFISTYMVDRNIVANTSSAIFSREVALKINRRYMALCGEGDWLFWIELMEQGSVFFCSKPLNYFRFHETNTTKVYERKGIGAIEHKIIFDYLVNFCDKSTLRNERLRLVHIYMNVPMFESKAAKRKVMNVWDKWHYYRLYLKASKIKSKFLFLLKRFL